MQKFKGRFKITSWNEQELIELKAGEMVKLAMVEQEYTGSLLGSSKLQYQIFYLDESCAEFVGTEHFKGHFEGYQCELTMHHKGSFKTGMAYGKFEVIRADIAKTSLEIPTKGSFRAAAGGHADYTLAAVKREKIMVLQG